MTNGHVNILKLQKDLNLVFLALKKRRSNTEKEHNILKCISINES